jgi:hypothetical protein
MEINKMMAKKFFINIALILLTGIIYFLYEHDISYLYINGTPSIFFVILVSFIIIFFNIFGFVASIIKIQKIYLTIIIYVLFIGSTVLVYTIINKIVITLETKRIMSECSSILFLGIIMIIENILSYWIVKTIIKINNGVRGNFA